jgi:Flp pilus assembly protein TadD
MIQRLSFLLAIAAAAALAAEPTPTPKPVNSLHERARTLAADGRMVEAKTAYRTLIEQQPTANAIRHEYGVLLAQAGELEASAAIFTEIVKRDPNDAEAHHLLGLALYKQGKSSQAIDAIVEALRLKPDLLVARKGSRRHLPQGKPVDGSVVALRRSRAPAT